MSRRLLIAADEGIRSHLCELLAPQTASWTLVEAGSLEQARFVQQLIPSELILVDSTLP